MNKHEIIDYTIDQFEREDFTNNKGDRGGATKFGITLKTLSKYRGRPCTLQDVQKLTREEAEACYEKLFWTDANIQLLPYEFQHIIFDAGVNCSEGNAAKMLQRAIRFLYDSAILVDGNIGPKTAKAAAAMLAKFGLKNAMGAIVDQRIAYYERIVERDPTQKKWINGWKNRAQWFNNNLPKPLPNGCVIPIA